MRISKDGINARINKQFDYKHGWHGWPRNLDSTIEFLLNLFCRKHRLVRIGFLIDFIITSMDFITFLDSLDSILVLNPDETILNLLEHNFF